MDLLKRIINNMDPKMHIEVLSDPTKTTKDLDPLIIESVVESKLVRNKEKMKYKEQANEGNIGGYWALVMCNGLNPSLSTSIRPFA